MNKILLIGCGHMGSSLLKAWSLQKKYSFIVVDPVKHKKIKRLYKDNVDAFSSLNSIKKTNLIDVVIFAVKPQTIIKVLENFKNLTFKKETIYISIIAGSKINFFNKYLQNKNQFVRAMPNMPAMINVGMTCLVSNKNVTKKNKNIVNSLFLSVGDTAWLKNESAINKVTAISGSGPGYVFLLIDAFEKAASKLGLGNKITKQLVHQTFLGSINLFIYEKKNASSLVDSIAVKGGTTEAGISIFKNKDILNKTFSKAVKAAYDRANKLGK